MKDEKTKKDMDDLNSEVLPVVVVVGCRGADLHRF